MHIRGKINNYDRARQQIDYSGLRFGNITPTDIDGLIEYKNKAYVIIECKYLEAECSYGQGKALERLTDDLENGKPALCVIVSHQTHDSDKDVNIANCRVAYYRLKNQWFSFNSEHIITTKEIIELFINNLGIDAENLESLCIENKKLKEGIDLASFFPRETKP